MSEVNIMKTSAFKTTFLALLAVAFIGSSHASEQIGEVEFTKNCSVCHGAGGKGNGPIVDFLKQAPVDLTQIRKKNGGQFPIQKVYDIIIDAGKLRAHGNQEMPIWGERYALETIKKEGEFGSGAGSVADTRARVLELVFFLATIQE